MLKHSADHSDSEKFDDLPMLALWPRGENGFTWKEGEPVANAHRVGGELQAFDSAPHDPGPWLMPIDRYGKPYPVLRRRASIYQDFVGLGKNASRDRVLAFANKWGALGEGERGVAIDGAIRFVASFGTWRQAAVKVAMLTGLWQLVKSSDVERLSDFVVWNSDYVAVQIPHVAGRLRPDLITLYETDLRRMLSELADPGDGMEQSVLAHKDRDPHGLRRRWTTDDPIEPVRYYVIREVNKALQGKVNRTVLPYWDGNVYYVPASLLAAVYVAFQDEIIKGVRTERACARCGSVFTVRRKDKIYCSDNCAKRASDARRRALRETSNGQKS